MSLGEIENISKSLVLVGMMGCGKSTIGKLLAKDTGKKFFDSDKLIEKKEGISVKKIFDVHGEEYFRQREYEIIRDLLNKKECSIIASGGGAFIHDITREYIKKKSYSIWLKSDFKVLLNRVLRNNNRPLLNVENKEEKLQSLIDIRYPIYSQADFHFFNNDIPNKILVRGILEHLIRVN